MSSNPQMEISMQKFRSAVDSITDRRDSILIKTLYLLAARNCEICRNVTPSELLLGKSKPYGQFMQISLKDFIRKQATETTPALIEKALVIRAATAKRGKRIRKKDKKKEQDGNETLKSYSQEDVMAAFRKFNCIDVLDDIMSEEVEVNPELVKVLLDKLYFKTISLPTSQIFEPWTYDLCLYMAKIRKAKDLSFNLTRKSVWAIVRRSLNSILPRKDRHNVRNFLRHWRITHFFQYYNMAPEHIPLVTGWSVRSSFEAAGQRVSSNLDSYLHLDWRRYFPCLLVPLKSFYRDGD